MPYARFAEPIGLRRIHVDTPERLAPAWAEALAADRPVVLEVKVDPDVAPLAPHLTLAQAKRFMSSIITGDRGGAGHVLADTARQLLHEAMPGKHG